MAIKMLRPDQLTTHWDKNPRKKNQQVIDGLYTNMLENGYNEDYPVTAFEFGGNYNLGDGHHRLEASIQAGLRELPVDVKEGGEDEHLLSLCFDNMQFDVALGTVGQMFTPAEKRTAIKQALTIPSVWEKSNHWLSKLYRISEKSIRNYRDVVGADISAPVNPLGLSEERRHELEELIMRAERVGEDGVWQPIKNCKIREKLLEKRKERSLKIVIEPEHAIIHNAVGHAYQDWKQMVAMSSETAKSLRRNFLRAVHPDKFDTSRMTEAERNNWHLMMNGFAKMLESLENQIAVVAANQVGVEISEEDDNA